MGILADQGMAIQSKAFQIWTRLYTRFSLEPGPSVIGGQPEVGTSIIPVTQVDELLRQAQVAVSAATDISGGGSLAIEMLTVPVGKRWRVTSIHRTSTIAASRVLMMDRDNNAVNITAAGTVEEMIYPGEALVMDEDWALGMRETGNAGDTAELLQITRTEEDAF